MADIFVAYSHADASLAHALARVLRGSGYSVFLDVQTPIGKRWHKAIEAELHAARAIVVLWSKASRDSDFVLEEAEYGRKKGNLFPAMLDQGPFPYGFARVQSANLIGWDGVSANPGLESLSRNVGTFLEYDNSAREVESPASQDEPWSPPDERHFLALQDVLRKIKALPYSSVQWLLGIVVAGAVAAAMFLLGHRQDVSAASNSPPERGASANPTLPPTADTEAPMPKADRTSVAATAAAPDVATVKKYAGRWLGFGGASRFILVLREDGTGEATWENGSRFMIDVRWRMDPKIDSAIIDGEVISDARGPSVRGYLGPRSTFNVFVDKRGTMSGRVDWRVDALNGFVAFRSDSKSLGDGLKLGGALPAHAFRGLCASAKTFLRLSRDGRGSLAFDDGKPTDMIWLRAADGMVYMTGWVEDDSESGPIFAAGMLVGGSMQFAGEWLGSRSTDCQLQATR